MAYTPREIKDRVAVGDDIFIVEDLGDNRVRLIPAPTHVLEVGTPVNKALLQPIENYLATGVVPVERTITAGNGLTGGGSLDADKTLSVKFGTTAGTVCEGNDYRLSNARTPTAHDHDDRYYTKSQLNTHMDATSGIHGATSSATANRIIIRDSAGRAKVAAPSASDDIARKAEVDAISSALNTHKDATSGIHGATSSATANRLIIRDSNGRASVADPTSASHIATKNYVDNLVGPLQAGTGFAYYLTPPNVELSSNNISLDSWWLHDVTRSVVVRILRSGTIRYHVQYHSSNATTSLHILQNGNELRRVQTSSSSWQTETGNITVSPGDIITIQKRVSTETGRGYWRNVRIETAQLTLAIQRF